MTDSPWIDRIPPAARRWLARAAGAGLVLAVFGPLLGAAVCAGWTGTVLLARLLPAHGVRIAAGLEVAAMLTAALTAPSSPLLVFAGPGALVLGLVDRHLTGLPAPTSSRA